MAETESPFPIFITTKQVCGMMQVSSRWLQKKVRTGGGPPFYDVGTKARKRLRFRKNDVIDWIEKHKR